MVSNCLFHKSGSIRSFWTNSCTEAPFGRNIEMNFLLTNSPWTSLVHFACVWAMSPLHLFVVQRPEPLPSSLETLPGETTLRGRCCGIVWKEGFLHTDWRWSTIINSINPIKFQTAPFWQLKCCKSVLRHQGFTSIPCNGSLHEGHFKPVFSAHGSLMLLGFSVQQWHEMKWELPNWIQLICRNQTTQQKHWTPISFRLAKNSVEPSRSVNRFQLPDPSNMASWGLESVIPS